MLWQKPEEMNFNITVTYFGILWYIIFWFLNGSLKRSHCPYFCCCIAFCKRDTLHVFVLRESFLKFTCVMLWAWQSMKFIQTFFLLKRTKKRKRLCNASLNVVLQEPKPIRVRMLAQFSSELKTMYNVCTKRKEKEIYIYTHIHMWVWFAWVLPPVLRPFRAAKARNEFEKKQLCVLASVHLPKKALTLQSVH